MTILQIVPLNLDEANALVEKWHRHHEAKIIARFAIGVAYGDRICGAAVVGNPVARGLQDGWTLEVNRVATDGTRNACSMLYRAAWRAAVAMGYRRLITYTLPDEGGEPSRRRIQTCRGAGRRLLEPQVPPARRSASAAIKAALGARS